MTEVERLAWYFSTYWMVIKAWLPVLVTGLVFAVIVWLIIFFTRRIVNRQWVKNPEEHKKVVQVKLACYVKEINRLRKENERLEEENRQLRVSLKSGIEQVRQIENIWREKL